MDALWANVMFPVIKPTPKLLMEKGIIPLTEQMDVMMKMADYSMDDQKWSKNENKVLLHLENNDVGDMQAVIEWNLNQGRNDPENRKRFWTNITNLFAMLPNSPISRGRESSLPDEIQQAIQTISAQYAAAFAAPFATDPLYGEIVRKHGKSGGGTYEDLEEYEATLLKSMKSRLTTYYRNHLNGDSDAICWDGSMNGHIPVISAPESSEADGGEEEE